MGSPFTDRRLPLLGSLALTACLAWPVRAGAQPQAAAQARPGAPRAWQIEAVAGFTRVAPDDLNARVAYDTAWLGYLRIPQVTQQHQGELLEVGDATPVAVRLTKRMARRWTAGGGFSYFSSEATSSASASYRYTVVDPRAQEYQREFSQSLEVNPLELQVRDYFPHGLIGYDVGVGSRLRLGGTLALGWVIADCTLTRSSAALGGFYATSNRTELKMTGRGGGVAADALLVSRLAVTSRVGVLVEGGFSWHEVSNVSGTRESVQRIQDGEAAEVEREVVERVDGRWINQPVTVQTASGAWRGTAPSIGGEGPPFRLSLSGWQFRVGVSLGL